MRQDERGLAAATLARRQRQGSGMRIGHALGECQD